MTPIVPIWVINETFVVFTLSLWCDDYKSNHLLCLLISFIIGLNGWRQLSLKRSIGWMAPPSVTVTPSLTIGTRSCSLTPDSSSSHTLMRTLPFSPLPRSPSLILPCSTMGAHTHHSLSGFRNVRIVLANATCSCLPGSTEIAPHFSILSIIIYQLSFSFVWITFQHSSLFIVLLFKS